MGGIASIGVPGLIIILVIVLIIFGPRKLPEIGGAVGKTFAEFKSSTKGLMDDDETEEKDGKDVKEIKVEKKSEKV